MTLAVITTQAAGNRVRAPVTIDLPGAIFNIIRGHGRKSGSELMVEAGDASGIAIVSAGVPEFAAERYSRIEWNVRAPAATPPMLTFVRRNREQPEVTFSKDLQAVDGRVAPLRLDHHDRWSGSIVGVALVIRGELSAAAHGAGIGLPSRVAHLRYAGVTPVHRRIRVRRHGGQRIAIQMNSKPTLMRRATTAAPARTAPAACSASA